MLERAYEGSSHCEQEDAGGSEAHDCFNGKLLERSGGDEYGWMKAWIEKLFSVEWA